jgi:NADH:ubiquinone oxidoreductase subunit 5 (subunit L)/multisubunit Na+/H+ antiporter MnhA subunit
MRRFFLSSTGAATDWLVFIAILTLVCFFIGIFVVWFTVFRKPGKRRRKRRRHHHHVSPTLAELGGLPPRRDENKIDSQPPP